MGSGVNVTRRSALMAAVAASAAACAPRVQAPPYKGTVTFDHGVASGDPGPDRVILWTRVSPDQDGPVPVRWAIARDQRLSRIVSQGVVMTDASRDYTVKVDAGKLKPGEVYYYGFLVNKTRSPVGRTKTLPQGGINAITLAAVSCANYSAGFFNAYEALAKRKNIDAILHLGDYIYEYGMGERDDGVSLGRTPEPPVEIVTLADYRGRHAQYKTDPDLQAAHASAPFICVWDDHEVANDDWMGGAQNHNAGEGDFATRKRNALQAYYEWLPIREPTAGNPLEACARSFQFGDLATLVMVETRLMARSQQLDYDRDLTWLSTDWDISNPAAPKPVPAGQALPRAVRRIPTPYDTRVSPPRPIFDWTIATTTNPQAPPAGIAYFPDAAAFKKKLDDPSRALLGPVQEKWIEDQLALSQRERSTWVVFGNQVLMAKVAVPSRAKLTPIQNAAIDKDWPSFARSMALQAQGLPPGLDSWNGYPAQRARFTKILEDSDANVIVLTGDSHQSWANELMSNDGATRIADEFAVTSVTSASRLDRMARNPDLDYGALMASVGGEVKWTEPYKRGFLVLTLTKKAAKAEFIAVSTIEQKDFETETIATYIVKPEKGPSVGKAERAA